MKTYRLTCGFRESYNFEIDGTIKEVLFTGGARQPRYIAGFFKTDNTILQNMLEKSPHFGVRYILENDSSKESDVPETPVVQKVSIVNTMPKTIINDVTSWSMAASYFRREYPDKYDNKTKKGDVLEAMKIYNVEFPNWEQ